MRLTTRIALLFACLTSASVTLAAGPESLPIAPKSAEVAHPKHECGGFENLSTQYQSRYAAPMKTWAQQHLNHLGTRQLTYLFSGADIVTALSLFPRAEHLILVANQWPEPSMEQPASAEKIAKECSTHAFFARHGYFRTNDLEGKDSVRPRFVKLLTYNLLISGAKIDRSEYLFVDANGALTNQRPADATRPEGLRYFATTAEGRPIKVDYVRIDLSNRGLQETTKFHRFLAENMAETVLIKSASHLLQRSYFSNLADLITQRSKAIVQDETGLDIEVLNKTFKIDTYGKFVAPHPLWQNDPSGKRLREFFSEHKDLPVLPFKIGYEKPIGSVLLVGTRKPATP
jgi:hypothetical protein